ncbi:CLUMA_CG013551, isoform A [Clunio marinus]|uniref:CLUMA_CG013551, isoform A n=1 Tax=Clunio marinus TaxID=568069 RepID=A0A1J1IMG6_9DIPT|nr:CLUMA_CG013551, isoform A [Clunio marinus]
MSVPFVTLKNGQKIPALGLGTWKSPPGQVEQAVKDAIDVGYRHIDCAFVYGNENEVGNAISEKIADGKVKREELFLTSKLWNTFHNPKDVKPALEKTLKNLKTDYLDLYLIHWPMGYKEAGDDLFPKNENGELLFSNDDYVDTWKAMENLVDSGLIKSIGLSNFNSKQIERVLEIARIPPVMNQVECHPYLTQKKLMELCRSKGIHITAYSPLGSPDRPWAKPGDTELMQDPKLLEISKKYNKSAAQILIKYQLQRGNIVIPKSVTKSRIMSNFDVFNFELNDGDIAAIDAFNMGGRFCPLNFDGLPQHLHYPFNIEY